MKKFELTKLPPYLILAIKVQCIIYTFFGYLLESHFAEVQ